AGALPGDAVAGIAALRLEPVRGSAAELRQLAGEYTGRAVDVPADWTGTAATAYAARAADLSGYLRDSAGRLTATAEYLDDVADWMVWARGTLAEALAVVLGSAEAVLLHGPAPDRAAGATIGAHVLDPVLAVHDGGRARPDRWAGWLDRPHSSTCRRREAACARTPLAVTCWWRSPRESRTIAIDPAADATFADSGARDPADALPPAEALPPVEALPPADALPPA